MMYIEKDSFQAHVQAQAHRHDHDDLRISDKNGTQASEKLFPTALDLHGSCLTTELAYLETCWSELAPRQQRALIDALHLEAPEPPACSTGVVILPGGALALRRVPSETLVCDPHSAVILGDYATRQLRTRLITGTRNIITTIHTGQAIISQPGVPEQLPEQACTIITDITPFAGLIPGFDSGPAMIGWRNGGAVVWALAQAPSGVALIAALAGQPVGNAAIGLWDAPTLADRAERIAPALHDHINDLLAGETSDALRWALSARAVNGANSLAQRLAAALQVLPAHFTADGAGAPGSAVLQAWPVTEAALRTRPALASLCIRHHTNCLSVLAALRDVLDNEGLFLIEHPQSPLQHPAVLGRPTADNLASAWQDATPCAALIAPQADPVALFTLAHRLAEQLDAEVLIAAPAWGFFHRIDAQSGADAGNAGWFGLGAGLDELEWI